MKNKVNRLFSVVLSASIFALASCEIGLGESVDKGTCGYNYVSFS